MNLTIKLLGAAALVVLAPKQSDAWFSCYAETKSGKIVELEVVAYGTGGIFGHATIRMLNKDGDVICSLAKDV